MGVDVIDVVGYAPTGVAGAHTHVSGNGPQLGCSADTRRITVVIVRDDGRPSYPPRITSGL